jgi:hypothetical protein
VSTGQGHEVGPKAFESEFWAWGGCLLAIAAALMSMVAASAPGDSTVAQIRIGWLSFLLGLLGFAFIVVQGITESDRSFGLYLGLAASAVIAGGSFMQSRGIQMPRPSRKARIAIWIVISAIVVVALGLAIWAAIVFSALSGAGG